MHEFSLCKGIISQLKSMQANNNDKIKTVKVVIGEMSGVDIESLRFWFPVVAEKMKMPQLQLDITTVTAQARCNNCQYQFRLMAYYQECPGCGSYANFEIIQGKELLIRSIIL